MQWGRDIFVGLLSARDSESFMVLTSPNTYTMVIMVVLACIALVKSGATEPSFDVRDVATPHPTQTIETVIDTH